MLEVEENSYQPLSAGFVVVLYFKVAFNLLASAACFFFIAAMLSKSAVRNNPYNLYVIFMILPDGVNTFFRLLTNLFIAANHGVKLFPPGYYYVDLFCWMFYYVANFFTNTIVTYEINKLVVSSYQRKRVTPPTVQKVLKQVTAVYLFATFMSLLMVLPVPFAIFHITNDKRGEGAGGSPQPGGWFNFWEGMAIGLSLAVIPVIYVLFIRIKIWKRNLLPERGRTRVLSLFFLRVVIIFVIFYIPTVLLTAWRQRMDDDSVAAFWVDTILGLLAAFQALTTLYMIWLKDDIQEAVNNAWNKTFGKIFCCCCCCCGSLSCCHWRHGVDSTGTVRVTGLSAPMVKKGESATDSTDTASGLSPSKRSGGDDSHSDFAQQFKNAWQSEDEYPQLPQLDIPETAPVVVDEEQPAKV